MSPKSRIDEAALLASALEEFGRHGYEDASVNAIIDRAGISKGSFYYRFSTKYELYVHLLRTGVRRKWEFIGERLDAGAGATNLFDEFLFQADLGVQFALEHPEYHRLSVMFSREKGTRVYEEALRDLGQDDSAGLLPRLRAAVAGGEIRTGFSDEFLERVVPRLFMLFDQIVFGEQEWDLERSRERLREYVELLRHGLAAG